MILNIFSILVLIFPFIWTFMIMIFFAFEPLELASTHFFIIFHFLGLKLGFWMWARTLRCMHHAYLNIFFFALASWLCCVMCVCNKSEMWQTCEWLNVNNALMCLICLFNKHVFVTLFVGHLFCNGQGFKFPTNDCVFVGSCTSLNLK